MGDTSQITPFEMDISDDSESAYGRRGYRAIVAIGQLDTDVTGLTPLNPAHRIAGASSDVTVLNIGDDDAGLRIGDSIQFRGNYSALLRLMIGKYTEQVIEPSVDQFAADLGDTKSTSIPPAVKLSK